jgi:hypothetical protein
MGAPQLVGTYVKQWQRHHDQARPADYLVKQIENSAVRMPANAFQINNALSNKKAGAFPLRLLKVCIRKTTTWKARLPLR